jgi:hypothetical protein
MKTQGVPTVSLAETRRGRRGWSQRDLSAASGVPAGERYLDVETWRRMCDVFNWPLSFERHL